MKTLYLECNMGAAGDMLAAALLELHPDPEGFLRRVNALGLPGVRITAAPCVKCGITGTHVSVTVNGQTVTASKTTAPDSSKAPTYTDSSKNDTTTATSGAAASTAGVIKATGLNTTGAAVVALAVASVLGAAAVKARKLGE